MQALPHHYVVHASGEIAGALTLESPALPSLTAWPPAEFDGPGDQWSPETLLTASLASCFLLTFRAVARASRVNWQDLRCSVTGTLDRVDGITRFSHFDIQATLVISAGTDEAAARRALEKVDRNCLVSASLSAEKTIQINIVSDSADHIVNKN